MIALALFAAAPLTCGAVPRPGVAELDLDGIWRGAVVDACRRAALRLGRSGIRFRGYRTTAQLSNATRDDIIFLTPAERRAVAPAQSVAVAAAARSTQLLVGNRASIAARRPILCFIIGSAAQDALEEWLDDAHREAVRLGFQEPDEMADGLASGKCAAMAVDAAERDAQDPVIATLATTPVDAITSQRGAEALAAALR